jgi:hypothetical protein
MPEHWQDLADEKTAISITDRALHAMQDKLEAERQKVRVLRDALGQIALNAAVMRPSPGWQECLLLCREALGATKEKDPI